MQVTRCARGSGCSKRRLRRPAEEKGGGGDGGLKVIGGEEGLERGEADRKSSWRHIEHLGVIVLVCIDLMRGARTCVCVDETNDRPMEC